MTTPRPASAIAPRDRADRALRSRGLAAWGGLIVAVVLGSGVALLGHLNRRSAERTADQALEGRALEVGLSAASALRRSRPSSREELREALVQLVEDPVVRAEVVGAGGRVLGSSAADEEEARLDDEAREHLRDLRRDQAAFRVERPGGGKAVLEVWILLRPGLGSLRRGKDHGGPGSGRRLREGGSGGGLARIVGGGRAFLRLEVQLADEAIAAVVRQARLGEAVAGLSALGLLLLAVLLFVADRRSRRLARDLEQQRALAAMGEMAAVLAHEIRTPLAVLKGHAQLLLEGADPALVERLGPVVSQAARLERLVNALLDFARPRPLRPAPASLAAVVDQACDLVAPDALERSVAVIRDAAPLTVQADADQLLQVLVNLLLNAIQASPAGSPITVRVTGRGRQAQVDVVDSGPGVPPELGDDIFKPFVTTRAKGNGLGLAIARRIAEAHGGTLVASREPGRGARFVLTLPVEGP
jgi:signal transduction histidine kinase